MPSLDKHDSSAPDHDCQVARALDTIREGRKYVVGAAAITVFAFLLHVQVLDWVLVGITLLDCFLFFRDPIRTTPHGREAHHRAGGRAGDYDRESLRRHPKLTGGEGLADGDYTRVSIFMSVFDVHINRAPITGRIPVELPMCPASSSTPTSTRRVRIMSANTFLSRDPNGFRIGMTQIAGLVAQAHLGVRARGRRRRGGPADWAHPIR